MDDLIDRQAAIDAFVDLYDSVAFFGKEIAARAIGIIKALPSAQPERLLRAVAGKSPEEIYDFLYWLIFDYARAFTDSRAAVIAWLKGEEDG